MNRAMVLLTWGFTNPQRAKTAAGLLRYCPDECLAVYDPDQTGKSAEDLLGIGRDIPVVGALDEVPGARTLVIGIAPPGGRIPEQWRPVILEAIDRGMNILSGLHEFLSSDAEFVQAAASSKTILSDIRQSDFRQVARYPEVNPECFRIHTVGHDCNVGKMLTSVTLSQGLQARGHDAQMIATGQTGIMVSGKGLPLDAIVADFVSGAAESLIVENQEHAMLVIEGQGSLVHPSYSAVTLGLLHGCRPHALVFVFEAGRSQVYGAEHVPLPSVAEQIQLFNAMASIHQPCRTVALAMNGSRKTAEQAGKIAKEMEQQLQLPVVDVVRDGPDRLLDTVEQYYRSEAWRG